MRVLLLDDEKITKITLPEDVDGFFVLKYKSLNSNITKELNIESVEDKWKLKSSDTLSIIVNNQIQNEIFLDNYMHIKIGIIGTNELLDLYSIPTIDKNFTKYNIITSQLYLGTFAQASIKFTNKKADETYARIYQNNDKWYIDNSECNSNTKVFLNDKKLQSNIEIRVGDIIFVEGVKIIWMQSFIQINSLNEIIICNPTHLSNYSNDAIDNTKYEKVSEEKQGLTLYKPEDYFFHRPNLKEYVTPETVLIDPPPQSEQPADDNPLLLIGASFTLIASALVSGLNTINNIINRGQILSIIASSLMFFSLIIGSLILPAIASKMQKKKAKKREEFRIKKYSEYLEAQATKIKHIISKQTQVLRDINLRIDNCVNLVNSSSTVLWNREIKDDDFLTIRMGMGNVPAFLEIIAPEEHFSLSSDELLNKIYDIVNCSRVLENVPVTFNFLKNRISAIVGSVPYRKDFVTSIILQLITLHSAQDLKMAFFIREEEDIDFNDDYLKYIPHTFSDDKSSRYYATSYDEMKTLSIQLENIFKERKKAINIRNESPEIKEDSSVYKNFDDYFIIFVNDVYIAKSLPIFELLLNEEENFGFSVVFLSKNMNKLPKRCNSFIALSENTGCIMAKNINSQITFVPEYLVNIDLKSICAKLLNVPLMQTDIQTSLPTSIPFLDIFEVSKIEQLNISNRWRINDPTISLSTPIGVHTNGENFILDLHEKAHGPHGLIAGSTGSGKSEFIITFVLSMCINYHPDEVQFVLIDYKGGGLAGAFENREKGMAIPHLAGTITNLDTAAMNRSLVSINSELKRREQKFMDARNETGESTLDIYKYQKYYREGLVKEPISHLFIISDEFAELKSQQPEFMSELISTARVGRSLGVHLILATQKPSGVVNDQIWSNARFKVCLKVQTSGDSNEMLKRPDAASIKEAGRFYLQVGYDEYFDIGQSGWAGAKYIPADRVIKHIDDSIVFINNIGEITKSINDFVKKDTGEDMGDQLTNIVKYLVNWSNKENYHPKKLWLDPIPENVYITNLAKKYNYVAKPYVINPIIGEYDNPEEQLQGLLTLDLNKGNTYIFGKIGSGKEELLSTIIFDTCIYHSPQEVIFYIVDMGAETLRQYLKYPHVADVCTVDDGNKIVDMMVLLEREIARRKDLTVDFGGNFETYNAQNEKKLPLYCVIINYLDIFEENFSKIAELIVPLYRDGAKYGVTFIITANSTAALRSRVREYFTNHISLQLPNKDDYYTILNNRPKGLIPSEFKGRGLVETSNGTFEFQSAYIFTKNEIPKTIKATCDALLVKYKDFIAPSIPSIPKIVTVDSLLSFVEGLSKIPIGYNIETKDKYFYNFYNQKANIITSNSFDEHKEFLNALLLEFKSVQNVDIKVIDFSELFDILTIGLTCYQNNFNDVFGQIIEEAEKLTRDTFYIITGISKLTGTIKPNNLPFINQYFIDSLNNKYIHFLFVETYSELNNLKMEEWYEKIVNPKYGIWLGSEVGSQLLINFDNLSSDDQMISNPDFIFACVDGKRFIIKKVVLKEESEENHNGE